MIIEFKKNITASVDSNELIKVLSKLPKKEVVYICSTLLDNDKTLLAFLKQRAKETEQNAKSFKKMSQKKDNVFDSSTLKAWGEVSKDYEEESKVWKHLVELKSNQSCGGT